MTKGKYAKALIVLVAVLLLVNAVGFIAFALQEPTVVEKEKLVIQQVSVPVVQEDPRVSDIFDKVYENEREEIEDEAETVVLDEVDEDDLIEFLEDSVEGIDEVVYINLDEVEAKVIELGLEEDSDKVAEVVLEYKVKYTLEEGQDVSYKDRLYVKGLVVFEEGDFDDEDVELNISL